ncbi:hypothetical protein AnigIFM59636_003519 [Aspergillus niger]|nr:hypothetical protein AnigIFM59636_003519 [Aspergillus niger]
MDAERQNAEPSNQDMSNQEHSSQVLCEGLPGEGQSSIDLRMALTPHVMHGPGSPKEADIHSRYTRNSAETPPSEPDLKDITTPEAQSREPEGSQCSDVHLASRQQVLVEYLDQLLRAQGEVERLDEEREHERLEEELGLSNQERPISRGTSFVAEDPADEPPEVTPTEEPGLTQGPISEPTQSPPQTGQPAGQAPVSSDYVNISFWSFGRDEWRQSDCLRVNPSDPSPVSRIARKYSWKNYSLYDKTLQSLSPAQCYRAATVDGNNAIFLISEHEEQRLAAEGRLNKDRHLLFLVSQVRDRAETQPKSPNKRHCSTSLGRV